MCPDLRAASVSDRSSSAGIGGSAAEIGSLTLAARQVDRPIVSGRHLPRSLKHDVARYKSTKFLTTTRRIGGLWQAADPRVKNDRPSPNARKGCAFGKRGGCSPNRPTAAWTIALPNCAADGGIDNHRHAPIKPTSTALTLAREKT